MRQIENGTSPITTHSLGTLLIPHPTGAGHVLQLTRTTRDPTHNIILTHQLT
jgi:hypothetical protein